MGGGLAVAIVGVNGLAAAGSWVGDEIEMPTKLRLTASLSSARCCLVSVGALSVSVLARVVLLGTGQWQAYVFVPAMLVGMRYFSGLS